MDFFKRLYQNAQVWSKRVWVLTIVFTVMTFSARSCTKLFGFYWVYWAVFGFYTRNKQKSKFRGEVKVVLSENAAVKGDIQDASSTDLLPEHFNI